MKYKDFTKKVAKKEGKKKSLGIGQINEVVSITLSELKNMGFIERLRFIYKYG